MEQGEGMGVTHCEVAGCRREEDLTIAFGGMVPAGICSKHFKDYGEGKEVRMASGKVLRMKITISAGGSRSRVKLGNLEDFL